MPTSEGSFPKVGNDPIYYSEINNFHNQVINNGYYKIYGYTSGTANYPGKGLIKFTDNGWQTTNSKTQNAGSTWIAGGFGDNMIVASNGIYGASIDYENAKSGAYTIDAGSTWNVSANVPPYLTDITEVSINGSVAIAIGRSEIGSAATAFSYTGGSTWFTSVSGPTGTGDALLMYGLYQQNTTTAYSTDGTNIYKTINGGSSWFDTTYDFQYGGKNLVLSGNSLISSNKGPFIVSATDITDGTKQTFVKMQDGSFATNSVTATNGKIYWVSFDSVGTAGILQLWKYDGLNVYSKYLIRSTDLDETEIFYYYSLYGQYLNPPHLIEVNNILYLNMYRNIVEIDVTRE